MAGAKKNPVSSLNTEALVTVEAVRDFYGEKKGTRKTVANGPLVRKMVALKNWKIVDNK